MTEIQNGGYSFKIPDSILALPARTLARCSWNRSTKVAMETTTLGLNKVFLIKTHEHEKEGKKIRQEYCY
jgi:hypothetical protein